MNNVLADNNELCFYVCFGNKLKPCRDCTLNLTTVEKGRTYKTVDG